MFEMKFRRIQEHVQRLQDDLGRPRVKISEASANLIQYCKATRDPLVPSIWGQIEDPYAPPEKGCECILA